MKILLPIFKLKELAKQEQEVSRSQCQSAISLLTFQGKHMHPKHVTFYQKKQTHTPGDKLFIVITLRTSNPT
jgi:hypothetical protein